MKHGKLVGTMVVVIAAGFSYWLGGYKTERAVQQEPARKILYYRNPMGLPDTSPIPKTDPMGMDYVPVYEGDAKENSQHVTISTEKVQKLGVKTEPVTLRPLHKTIRAVARIEANERHIYTIAPKFEGWIEKLHVNTTGATIQKGQALFDVYSPELVSAQREYALAMHGAASLKNADPNSEQSMRALAEASLLRLKNWDISTEQIKRLARSGAVLRNITFYSPVNGVVLEKKAVQGMRFMPGEMLYQIADLSWVWVMADVFEQDIAWVKTGTKAHIKINAYPDKVFEGTITYIYPTLNSETRTVSVRIEVANPRGLLKPSMFAEVEIPATGKNKVLTVATNAVIDSGTRQIVLVQLAEGRFEPRTVTLGKQSNDSVEVLSGVAEGEKVVVSANFLIDSESNLKAALSSFGHTHDSKAPDAATTPPAAASTHEGH